MELGEIQIKTNASEELTDFFTEVFDASPAESENGAMLLLPGMLDVCFIDAGGEPLNVENQIRLTFRFDDVKSLGEVHSNIQFYLYRRSDASVSVSDINTDNQRSYFIFNDLEGREWLFYCP